MDIDLGRGIKRIFLIYQDFLKPQLRTRALSFEGSSAIEAPFLTTIPMDWYEWGLKSRHRKAQNAPIRARIKRLLDPKSTHPNLVGKVLFFRRGPQLKHLESALRFFGWVVVCLRTRPLQRQLNIGFRIERYYRFNTNGGALQLI